MCILKFELCSISLLPRDYHLSFLSGYTISMVYRIPIAAVTNHKHGSLRQHKCVLLNCWNPSVSSISWSNPKVQARPCSLQGFWGGDLLLGLFQLLELQFSAQGSFLQLQSLLSPSTPS